jgi:hypothetical protein
LCHVSMLRITVKSVQTLKRMTTCVNLLVKIKIGSKGISETDNASKCIPRRNVKCRMTIIPRYSMRINKDRNNQC